MTSPRHDPDAGSIPTRSGPAAILLPSERRTAVTAEAFARLSQEVVVVADPAGTLVYASPAVTSLFGYELAEVVTCDMWEFVHPDDLAAGRAEFGAVLQSRAARTSRLRVATADGRWRTVELSAVNLVHESVGGVMCTLRDVTELVEADAALRASEAKYRAIADTAEEGIWALGLDHTTLYVNARMADILGVSLDAAHDFAVLQQLDPRAAAEIRSRLLGRAGRGPERYEISYAHPDGRERRLWVSASTLRSADGTPEGSLAMVSDITDIRAAEEELRETALRDSLTRLPNRVLLLDRLEQALSRSHPTSVLLLDLDDFNVVNDSRGHHLGDQLLIDVAARLRARVQAHDTVARFGGDEFVVVCENTDTDAARSLATELLAALRAPFEVDGEVVHISASVGVASSSERPEEDGAGATGHDLLRYADAAMYSAKAAGRGRVRVFHPTLAEDIEDRYSLAGDLRVALTTDALDLHYQPIVDVQTGNVLGMEALARWTHPDRGVVSPVTFVAVAERSGLAGELDRWVLRRALDDMRRLRAARAIPDGAYLSVNLSARNLGDVTLDADLVHWAQAADLPNDQICLEVTETALMQDAPAGKALLTRLRAHGFRIAIDDFGTGYSSLAYLRDLPITTLKIDRSFIADITTSSNALAIAVSIIDLGRAVGVDLIAEGVETLEQAQALSRAGCANAQGWLWSHAQSQSQIVAQPWTSESTASWARTQDLRRRRQSWQGPTDVTERHGLHRLMELHASGASHMTIAAALNADGYRTPQGFRWHARSVARTVIQLAYPALLREPLPAPPPYP